MTAKNAKGGLIAGLTCPLEEACGSRLESFLLQDIVGQLPNDRGVVVKQLRGRRNSAVTCQNHQCPFMFYHHERTDFEVLFTTCPGCREAYCLTCKSRLSSQGFRDHICPINEDDEITDKDISRGLLEALTGTLSIPCPSKHCQSSDQDEHLVAKEPADCNAVKCDRCRRFFCYICLKDLGTKRQEAHNRFPHRNIKMADAPRCWLFDDEQQGQTESEALQIRQVIAVMEFMSSLAISNERKATVLNQNREWLGEDNFAYLTKRNHLKRNDRCVFM